MALNSSCTVKVIFVSQANVGCGSFFFPDGVAAQKAI